MRRQPVCPRGANRPGRSLRRQTGSEQRFADIDIAESRHNALVEKSGLKRRPFSFEGLEQGPEPSNALPSGSGPNAASAGNASSAFVGGEIEVAEAPGIVKPDNAAILSRKDDVIDLGSSAIYRLSEKQDPS